MDDNPSLIEVEQLAEPTAAFFAVLRAVVFIVVVAAAIAVVVIAVAIELPVDSPIGPIGKV